LGPEIVLSGFPLLQGTVTTERVVVYEQHIKFLVAASWTEN
jgi:hypothetical protein